MSLQNDTLYYSNENVLYRLQGGVYCMYTLHSNHNPQNILLNESILITFLLHWIPKKVRIRRIRKNTSLDSDAHVYIGTYMNPKPVVTLSWSTYESFSLRVCLEV